MDREIATHTQDLPHAFNDWGYGVLCATCRRERADALHAETAREVASTPQRDGLLPRELGS